MKFLTFKNATEMYNALIDGPDLYSPTKELLIFHYNAEGAIAHYDIDSKEAAGLVKDSRETGEEWCGLLGPGGYIVDTLDNGEDITPVIEYLEDICKDVWMTTEDYAEMLSKGIIISVGDKEKDEDIVTIQDDTIKAVLEDIGEGHCGDYDPEDESDEQLLRFTVYINEDGCFEQMEDASYCTQIPLNTPFGELARLCKVIFDEYRDEADAYRNGSSVKKMGEQLSWLAPKESEVAA
jgi:hypothetical protein